MDNTPLAMAQRLESAMEHITTLCKSLDEYGTEKAQALIDYECALATIITILKDNGIPATNVKDLAKKDCRDERLACELAEIKYKSLLVKITAAIAILNARQSQNRYLDNF